MVLGYCDLLPDLLQSGVNGHVGGRELVGLLIHTECDALRFVSEDLPLVLHICDLF